MKEAVGEQKIEIQTADWVDKEMSRDDECYYGFGMCIDGFCRDVESCVGCPLLEETEGKEQKQEAKQA